ncbi:ankyrin repeat domain-containing protein 6-like isoform X8 [Myiozetetes cayanensis]|uniref:ankyrin repeat domain-containing protein 6-like isoform X8 n=1 Tax=Myiozetetes cayanensis TaxID=478635 RepID=UPI00215F92AC|nr:ankyrin repeat domain-containing protein 6-like isoform X8 [Myiozetetes cayanensis]
MTSLGTLGTLRNTALHICALYNKVGTVMTSLMTSLGTLGTLRDTALHICALYNKVGTVMTSLMMSLGTLRNTALHICALYNKESCARILLYRGANKEVKNNSGQTPFQVAVIVGNF